MPELPSLWVPYVWVISAIFLLIGVVVAVSWGFRSGQFDEKIKYQMFEELDDDMYLDETEQELSMRRKKMARTSRLKEEAEEERVEAAQAAGKGDDTDKPSKPS